MTRPAPRGYIFDLDGTLVDAFADIAAALNDTRARYGLPALPVPEVRAHVGRGSRVLVEALVPGPPEQVAEALAFYVTRYEERCLEQTRPLPGVPKVLEGLGGFPLAVVTNKPQRITRRILEGLGLWPRFRMVLGGDALARGKPDPLPVRHVLDCFALAPSDVVLVGDGLPDVQAGRAAGVRTVAVTTGVESRAALEAQGPDFLIERLDALLTLFA